MKRVIVFTLLKIGEISAIVFIPYLVGLFFIMGPFAIFTYTDNVFGVWFIGIFTIVVSVIVFGASVVFITDIIPEWIQSNWKLSGKIVKK